MRKPKHIRDAEKARLQAIVLANQQANVYETSKGYRLSPSPKLSHAFHIHPGKGAGRNPKHLNGLHDVMTETKAISTRYVSTADRHLTDKQRQSKYRLQDSELYETNQKNTLPDNRCMVRIGTIPEHWIVITDKDTGEETPVKIPPQPRYKEVGLP